MSAGRPKTITYDDGSTLRNDPVERGTRHFFGRDYHWARTAKNVLTLRKGPDPMEYARLSPRERLVADMPQSMAVLAQDAQ